MVGVITDVHQASDGAVVRFRLSTSEDASTWWIDPGRDYGFNLLHLRDHRATGDPVVVIGTTEAGRLVAANIEDA
jgi:hypothetical protein